MSIEIERNKIIEELYIEMYPKLLIYARNSLNDRHLAEEAVQETFRIACARADRFMESQNRQGWLTITLKNIILNARRNQAKLKNVLLTIMTVEKMSTDISEDNVDLEMYCTSALGKEDFELIKRIVIENRTVIEVSKELGISVEACKKRVQRAKKKLKNSLTENFL